MKPRVFVGCSVDSKESLDVARAIQQNLEYDAEVIVLDQEVFELSQTEIEALERLLEQSDFGVFVFSPEDIIIGQEQKYTAERDNVVFVLGLFMGKLGRSRSFIFGPVGHDLFLPSYLRGITHAKYDYHRSNNVVSALGTPCNRIRQIIRRLGPVQRQGDVIRGIETGAV